MKNLIRRILNDCNATPKDISEKSGMSLPVISRYLSGNRLPDRNGEHIERLAAALSEIINERTPENHITQKEMLYRLRASIVSDRPHYAKQLVVDNLKRLIIEMDISTTRFADEIFYSPSGLSRILAKQNSPRDIDGFVELVIDFAVDNFIKGRDTKPLLSLVERCTGIRPHNIESAVEALADWLVDTHLQEEDKETETFLKAVDEFNFGEYMSNVDVEAVKDIPVMKFKLPITKSYKGQSGLEAGMTDFLKATVTSSINEPIFIFSDHPIEHLSQNPEIMDNWVKVLGAAILQGKKVQVIHTMNRPLNEIIIGLEKWLPLYMTGNVSSYYSEKAGRSFFNHILMVSGSAVISGNVAGSMSEGVYIFSKATPRIAEGRRNANSLLEECEALVDVYTKDNISEYREFLAKDAAEKGERITYNDCLPIYTLSDELIDRIIRSNKIDCDAAETIKAFIQGEKDRIAKILGHSKINEIVHVPEAVTQKNDIAIISKYELHIRELSKGVILEYGYDDYLEHIRLTEKFEADNRNYHLIKSDQGNFKRMRIAANVGSHITISRNAGQELHFLIRYPDLTNSIVTYLYNMMELQNDIFHRIKL